MYKTALNYVYYQVVSIDGTPRACFRTVDGYKDPKYWDYTEQTWLPSDSFISYFAKGDNFLQKLDHDPKQTLEKNEIK
jgi:hypothetical protein